MAEPGATARPVRARAAVAALFLTNGATYAGLVPRFPDLKDALALSNAEFGAAIAAFPLGSLLAGPLAALVQRRWGSAAVSVWCSVLLAADLVLVAVAGWWWALAGALLVAGALDAIVDVAMNAHGLRVQRRYGRSIVNSLHGLWSLGAIIGGITGSLAAGAAVPLPLHLCAAAVVLAAVAVLTRGFLLPGDDRGEQPEAGHGHRIPGRRLVGVLVALGMLCAAAALVEDTAASWGAVYLREELSAAPALAGMVFVALQAAQMAGRFSGDRVVHRFGPRAVARCGGVLVLLGTGSALLWPSPLGTIAGFAVAGCGIATLIPAGMHAADELPGLPPGTGLAVVGWVYRIGILSGPPVVGLLADAYSLRAGLLVVPVAGLLVLLLAVNLPTGRPTASGRDRS
ncbi:MFS transporter [Saccharopolyspora sp. HNM0983]|uniref:MFS transporter n=1 Tax=Saccharopolyspora montiporae TaxID=2781240 RepID=A0A929G1H1_9PSEU|nr:MFS transporter [Saccharopolyspora sp. HNM0983]MBE9376299.1 MFS transporter [Saccharopolyspora sp. HNM0983]